jgi:hypothetical protein
VREASASGRGARGVGVLREPGDRRSPERPGDDAQAGMGELWRPVGVAHAHGPYVAEFGAALTGSWVSATAWRRRPWTLSVRGLAEE